MQGRGSTGVECMLLYLHSLVVLFMNPTQPKYHLIYQSNLGSCLVAYCYFYFGSVCIPGYKSETKTGRSLGPIYKTSIYWRVHSQKKRGENMTTSERVYFPVKPSIKHGAKSLVMLAVRHQEFCMAYDGAHGGGSTAPSAASTHLFP